MVRWILSVTQAIPPLTPHINHTGEAGYSCRREEAFRTDTEQIKTLLLKKKQMTHTKAQKRQTPLFALCCVCLFFGWILACL